MKQSFAPPIQDTIAMLDADNDEDFIQIIDLESKTACGE